MENSHGAKKNGGSFEIIASTEPELMDDDFGVGYKDCKVCGDTKPLVEFRVDAKGVGGRKAKCKSCSPTTNTPRTVKDAHRRGAIRNEMIRLAMEAAAYRIIKESM